MLLRSIVEYICFAFVSITFPIYIFYVVILLKYRTTRELKGTFFKLCISIAIGDIISMINNYVGYRFPSWGWGVSIYADGGPLLAKAFIIIAWFLRAFQGIGVVMLAINRMTAVVWPQKYLTLWSPRVWRAAIAFPVLSGFVCAAPLFSQDYHWQIDNESHAVVKFDDDVYKAKYFMAAFFFQTVTVILIIICYIATFAAFRRSNKHGNNTVSSRKNKQELNLALMGAIVCSFELIWFVFIFYTSVICPLSTDTFFLIYNPLTDLYSGINPYLMYGFCSAVRDKVKIILHLKKSPALFIRPAGSNISQISRTRRSGSPFPSPNTGPSKNF